MNITDNEIKELAAAVHTAHDRGALGSGVVRVCAFCRSSWRPAVEKAKHEKDCVVVLAEDVLTGERSRELV